MTKGQITELIMRAHEPRPHRQIVEKYLDLVFAQSIIPLFNKDSSNLDLYAKRYDNIAIVNGVSTIPVPTIQFTDSANGVRQVYALEHKDIRFVPEKEGQKALYDLLEVGEMDTSVGYTPTADRVYFDDNLPVTVTTVSMNVVPMPSALNDNDEFILPAGFDQQAMIAGFMAKIPPVDKANQ
jgi:hypothetical protein